MYDFIMQIHTVGTLPVLIIHTQYAFDKIHYHSIVYYYTEYIK